MQESVPQSLKDRILKEVDINNDGVIDYDEFLLLGKLLHQIHLKLSAALRPITSGSIQWPNSWTYLGQKALRVSLLAIHSHLY
jgi:hypothetical protein